MPGAQACRLLAFRARLGLGILARYGPSSLRRPRSVGLIWRRDRLGHWVAKCLFSCHAWWQTRSTHAGQRSWALRSRSSWHYLWRSRKEWRSTKKLQYVVCRCVSVGDRGGRVEESPFARGRFALPIADLTRKSRRRAGGEGGRGRGGGCGPKTPGFGGP